MPSVQESISQMLKTHPQKLFVGAEELSRCIRECLACEQVCVSCADACLGEENVQALRRCIRLNLDCADLCNVTARLLSRQQDPDLELIRRQVQLLAEVCRRCGEECARHQARHEHCRVCAEACRSCEDSCNRLLQTLGASVPTGVQA
jgi:hypothetical protein